MNLYRYITYVSLRPQACRSEQRLRVCLVIRIGSKKSATRLVREIGTGRTESGRAVFEGPAAIRAAQWLKGTSSLCLWELQSDPVRLASQIGDWLGVPVKKSRKET